MKQINSLEIIDRSDLAPHAERLNGKTRELLKSARSESTRRVYRVQWTNFEKYCEQSGQTSLPATVGTVADFIGFMVESGYKASTIGQSLSAIGLAHRLAGHTDITKTELVKQTAKGARNDLGVAPHKKTAITLDILSAMAEDIDRTTLQGKRDTALLLLGFSGAFRRSELVALDVEDLERTLTPSGRPGYLVTVRKSKTDQEGEGMIKGIYPSKSPLLDPVKALNEWISASGITSGAIFRRVRKGDKLTDERLTGKAVALVVKGRAKKAGISLDLSAHSLRSGFITSALEKDAPERQVMNQTGHKSTTVMRSYNQRKNAMSDNAMAILAEYM
ncbi:MAG: site-specific integrase [Bacteroidia bacterium]|nr:site-specific integrase [Bacteroidia bacterium]